MSTARAHNVGVSVGAEYPLGGYCSCTTGGTSITVSTSAAGGICSSVNNGPPRRIMVNSNRYSRSAPTA